MSRSTDWVFLIHAVVMSCILLSCVLLTSSTYCRSTLVNNFSNLGSVKLAEGETRSSVQHSVAARLTVHDVGATKDKCLILYHVPKAMGTSLHDFVQACGLRLWTHYWPEWREWPVNASLSDRAPGVRIEDADVYMGHWGPKAKTRLSKWGMRRNCSEATMLREPLSRTLSAYGEMHENEDNASGLFREFSQGKGEEYRNNQCGQLGYGNITVAQHFLCGLDFVFIFPDVHGIQEAVRKVFGGALPLLKFPHRNSKRKNNALSKRNEDMLIEANRCDLKLFDWANATFATKRSCIASDHSNLAP